MKPGGLSPAFASPAAGIFMFRAGCPCSGFRRVGRSVALSSNVYPYVFTEERFWLANLSFSTKVASSCTVGGPNRLVKQAFTSSGLETGLLNTGVEWTGSNLTSIKDGTWPSIASAGVGTELVDPEESNRRPDNADFAPAKGEGWAR